MHVFYCLICDGHRGCGLRLLSTLLCFTLLCYFAAARSLNITVVITSAKEMFFPMFVCLSECLSATSCKYLPDFHENFTRAVAYHWTRKIFDSHHDLDLDVGIF